MFEHTTVALTLIGLTGIACQWLAWWLKLPAILFLLLAGLAAGPVTGLLDPDALFGELLFPIVSLGVAVVLFEGGLTLRLHEVRGVAHVVRNLVTIGALVTWGVIAAAAHWLAGFGWELALLFGAVVVVTGPTVITPLLRTMRPKAQLAHILRWEGIIIDPVGALLAVLVFEAVLSGRQDSPLLMFGAMLLTGMAAGAAGAYALAFALRRHLLPHYLTNVATLALVLGVYSGANALAHESGLVAVTLMGMMLSNWEDVRIEEVLDFKESLSVLLISVLFIVLAARLEPEHLSGLGLEALALLAVVLFLARPLAVAASTAGSALSWRERALLAWVAPRGIVAAAVAALFALRLKEVGVPGADALVPLTFMVIIGSVLLQSATARPLARLLRLAEPEPSGVLIVGAHRVARAVGAVLKEHGFRAVLADTHWENIREARMAGLDTYFGSAVSGHAERNLDLVGIGRLLAMSQRPTYNALACLSYRNEFGSGCVYALKTAEEKDPNDKKQLAAPYACARLFDAEATLDRLAALLGRGGEIHSTRLTEAFDFPAYVRAYRHKAIPLFAVTPTGLLRIFAAGRAVEPKPGWSVIGLIPADVLDVMEQRSEHKAGRRKTGAEARGGDAAAGPDSER